MGLGDLGKIIQGATSGAGKASRQAASLPGVKASRAAPAKAVRAKAAPAKRAVPSAAPRSGPFLPGIPKPLEGAPKLQKALSNLPPPRAAPAHHGGGGVLGALEGAGSAIGDFAEKGFDAAYGTRKGTKGGVEAGRAAPGAAMASPIDSRHWASVLGTAAENTPGSAVRTIVGVVPGLVGTGKAILQAGEGKPGALEQIGKGLGEVAMHPVKSFEKEPVPVGLMALGAEAGAGTAAGEVARSGALGGKAAAAADTARPALELYNGLSIPRQYSSDVIRKGAQVAADKFREKVLNDPNVNLATGARLNRHIYGGGLLGQHLEHLGVPLVGQQGFFKPGLVDKTEAASKSIRRMHATAASGLMEHVKPKGMEEAVPLAVEGTIRTAETAKMDLERRLAALRQEAHGLTGNEARLNNAQQDQITGLLANKKFLANPQPAIDAAQVFADHQHPLTERKIHLGAMEPDQMHAKMVPYATHHMGATYNVEPGPHPLVGDVKALEEATRTAERRVKAAQAKRDNAAAPNPRVPSNHPVALAQNSVKQAEQRTAFAEGRSTSLHGVEGPSPRMLNPAKLRGDAARARAWLQKEKAEHLAEHTEKLTAAKDDLLDKRGALLKANNDLAEMKSTGLIKANGDRFPRLEVNGRPLTYDEIQGHARANIGNREIGFLTHKETSWGQATNSRSSVRPAILKQTRTGLSYKRGTYDSSWDALKRQAHKDATEVAGHEGRNELIRRFGMGSYHTLEEAQKAADNFNHSPEGERIKGALGEVVVEHAGPDQVLNRAMMPSSVASKTLQDFGLVEHKAIHELGPEGKYRLLPKMVDERLKEHDKLNNSTKAQRSLQSFTNKWRSAALFATPRWPVGTTQENMIRLAFSSINPFAAFGLGPTVKLGSDLTDHFRAIAADPSVTEAQRFAARAQVAAIDSGTQYGGYIYNSIHRPHADVLPAEAKAGMEAFNDSTPMSQMIAGWNKWKTFVGNGMHRMESNTKRAMLGKVALGEQKRFSGEWKSLLSRQDRAVKAYAEGKLAPSVAAKLGDDIMDMAGNWSTLTPAVRRATQTYTPFGLWWLNSMKFVFRTLPKDHPFKTAALAAMEAGTGASKGGESKTPAYLAGGVGVNLPIVGHVTMTPTHYSPFGIGVEPEKTAAEMVLPQLSEPAMTAMGINPLTYQSETRPGAPEMPIGTRLGRALETFPEALIPGARMAEQIARQGGKRDTTSLNPIATKPGTQTGLLPALAKALSPLPFTVERQQAGAGRLRERPVRERPIRERAARAVRERPVRERG